MHIAEQAVSVVIPIGGLVIGLHKIRVGQWQEVSDKVDRINQEVSIKMDRLDGDIDGLVKQLGELALDSARSYVTKIDHVEATNRLNSSIVELHNSISALNRQLVDIAGRR